MSQKSTTPFSVLNEATLQAKKLKDANTVITLLNADYNSSFTFQDPNAPTGSKGSRRSYTPMSRFSSTLKEIILLNIPQQTLEELPINKLDINMFKSLPNKILQRFTPAQQREIAQKIAAATPATQPTDLAAA